MTLSPSDYIALSSMLLVVTGSVMGYLHKVRVNDLRHLDMKIDEVRDSVNRIESKLDGHMRDHAMRVFEFPDK